MDLVIHHLFQLPFPIQNMNECFSQMITKRKHNCTIKILVIFFSLRFAHFCSAYQLILVHLTLGSKVWIFFSLVAPCLLVLPDLGRLFW